MNIKEDILKHVGNQTIEQIHSTKAKHINIVKSITMPNTPRVVI